MDAINTQELYTNSFGDQYFQAINQTAFDRIGAKATLDKTFKDVFDGGNMLYILVGSDSGLMLSFLSQFSGNGRKFVIYERPEMIDYIKQNIAYSEDDFLVVPTDFSLYSLDQYFPDHVVHARYQLVRSLSIVDGHCALYRDLWDEMETNFNIFTTTESGNKITNIFINSNMENISQLEKPLGAFPKMLEGTTAIIMGGGPTLDESIDWIRDNQDNLVIFSAARISKRLSDEGIHSDFYVTVDPHDVSYDNSKGMLKYGDNSTLIHTNYANNKLLANWQGAHAYLGSRIPWAEANQPDNLSVAGPTVTNTMVSVALFMGCEQIVFAGVDFCYSASGASHESTSLESKAGRYLDNAGGGQVETYSGRMAETTSSFANARNAMELTVEASKQAMNTEFYSLSAEAAKIEGVTASPGEQINIAKIDKAPLVADVNQVLGVEKNSLKKFYAHVLKQIQNFRKISSDALKWSDEGKKAADQLFINHDNTDKLTKKIVKLKNQIQKNVGTNEEFYFQYAIHAFADFMDPSVDAENQTHDEIKQSLQDYFSGLHTAIEPVLEQIDLSLQVLKTRQKELEGSKHFAEIAKAWRQREEFGRIFVWLTQNGLQLDDLDDEQRVIADELIADFEHEFEAQSSKLDKRLNQQAENLKNIYDRIQKYFSEKRTEELDVISKYLATMTSNRADQLQFLAQGYLLELKGQHDAAVAEYTQIKDEELLLHGLKRVTTLALEAKNFEMALNALEVLVNYSDEYYISYADILSALGDVQGAIQIYHHYLTNHDDDLAAWIKITKALIHESDMDNAQIGLDKIQELDANNPIIAELQALITAPMTS